MVKIAYDVNLPYISFWSSVSNYLLLNFAEIFDHQLLIQTLFYVVRQKHTAQKAEYHQSIYSAMWLLKYRCYILILRSNFEWLQCGNPHHLGIHFLIYVLMHGLQQILMMKNRIFICIQKRVRVTDKSGFNGFPFTKRGGYENWI